MAFRGPRTPQSGACGTVHAARGVASRNGRLERTGHRLIEVDGTVVRGFPTPSGRLEFWSCTLVDWGWQEYAIPTYIKSHIHPDNLEPGQMPLITTFRMPTQIHTRTANSKWLDELAHTNPLWIHPQQPQGWGSAPATWSGWNPASVTSSSRHG